MSTKKQPINNRPRHLTFVCMFLAGTMALASNPTSEPASVNLEDLATEATPFESHLSLVVDSSVIHHCCPFVGKVISPFGSRGGRRHTGSDIKLQQGDTVKAALTGVVKMAKNYSGYGKLVIISHADGYETYYSHLSKMLVKEGESVIAAQPIGLGGRTGRATTNHLHFEVRRHGAPQNPERYFDFASGSLKKNIVVGARELVFGSHDKKHTAGAMAAQGRQTSDSTLTTVDVSCNDPQYVRVQKGDTLYSLGKRHGKTVKELQSLNNLKGTLLKIGQQIRVY